jgi:hypothetical protein
MVVFVRFTNEVPRSAAWDERRQVSRPLCVFEAVSYSQEKIDVRYNEALLV